MKYDTIIIGSGQACNPLAYRLADLGWSVALIEKKHLGGTCINVGCTPTKTMVHRAQVAHYARNAARWGVNASNVSVDLAKIVAQKDEVVLSFRSGRQKQIDKRPNLRLYHGHARFVAPRSEEHTSELQSRSDLVCRLLLEKKKKTLLSDPQRTRLKFSQHHTSIAMICFNNIQTNST